uniref:OSJNBb0039L24.14 protein n=1 Tax=Oryza sativa subsp. japonica TaxID=39947 RepID=Q7XMK4_ORYSJ|nr:OSJNBb0039L24.14 [Oryza sativa Japonica Group]
MAQLINREENLQKVPEQVGPSVKLQMKWMELVACRHPSLSSSISRKAAMHPTRRGTRDDVGRRFLKTALHKLLGLSVQGFSSRVYEDPQLNAATPGICTRTDRGLARSSSYHPNPVRSPVRKALARYTCRPLHPARCPFGPGPGGSSRWTGRMRYQCGRQRDERATCSVPVTYTSIARRLW